MRHIVLLTFVLLCFSSFMAHANPKETGPQSQLSIEKAAVGTGLLVCATAAVTGTPVENIAEKVKFPLLPPQHTAVFGKRAKYAYAVPPYMGDLVLVVTDHGMCQVFVRKMDAKKFWLEVTNAFEGPKIPFQKTEDKRLTEKDATRTYEGTFKSGKVIAIISASDVFVENGKQALITIGRSK